MVRALFKSILVLVACYILQGCNGNYNSSASDSPNYVIYVETSYAAEGEIIEELISIPLESEIRRIQGVAKIQSQSSFGLSIVMVSFNWEINQHEAIRDVKDAVDKTMGTPSFPQDLDPLIYAVDESYWPQLSLVVTHDNCSADDFEGYIEYLAIKLNALPETAKISFEGLSDRYVQIELDLDELDDKNLLASDVEHGILNAWKPTPITLDNGQHIELAIKQPFHIHTIYSAAERIRMHVSDYPDRFDLENTVISLTKTKTCYLKDLIKSIEFKGEISPPFKAEILIHKRVEDAFTDFEMKIQGITDKARKHLTGVNQILTRISFDKSSHDLFAAKVIQEKGENIALKANRDNIRKYNLTINSINKELTNLILVYPELSLEALLDKETIIRTNHGEYLRLPLNEFFTIE